MDGGGHLMSPDTSATAVYADFAGQYRKFELRLGEIGELERRCGAGIGEIMVRLGAHRFYAHDIVEPIRLGLIGGGEPIYGVEALMRFNVHGRPLVEHIALAAAICGAAVVGVSPPKGDAPGEDPEGNAGTEGHDAPATSRSSTAPAAPSASPPERSTV